LQELQRACAQASATGFLARMAAIDDHHARPGAGQQESGPRTRRATADDRDMKVAHLFFDNAALTRPASTDCRL